MEFIKCFIEIKKIKPRNNTKKQENKTKISCYLVLFRG